MKIFITGAEGFFGSHLTEHLINSGFRVTALIQYNSFHNYGWLDDIRRLKNKNITFLFGDIRDGSFMTNATKNYDLIINLAALISIPYSYSSVKSFLDTNIIGTYNVLEAAKKNNIKQLIHTSTSEVYGTALYSPIDEKHPLQPQSPYSASKISADNLVLSYFYSYNLPVTILRPFNMFGPRQSTRAIIPTIITQILKKSSIELGNLNVSRDFNFVKDIAEGYKKSILNNKTNGQIINLGSGLEIKINELLKIIKKISNKKFKIKIKSNRTRPENSEVFRLIASNKKALKILNWKPKFSSRANFEKALRITYDWYKDPYNLKNFYEDDYNL
jgi:NAD dependent epimerase/dehydratase